MDAKEMGAIGNGFVHIIRALGHNEQLGLMMALNQAVLTKHGPDCALLVCEDMLGWINEMKKTETIPTETDPMKIN